MFLKISQNSLENTCALACNFIKKETLTQVFSCELCEISKNTFPYRTPPGDYFCICARVMAWVIASVIAEIHVSFLQILLISEGNCINVIYGWSIIKNILSFLDWTKKINILSYYTKHQQRKQRAVKTPFRSR